MANQCRRALIEGRVQGVWYRGSTQQEARKLGVTGWAKNLPDGRVEVLMCGEGSALDKLEAWLHKGPPMARVIGVSVSSEPEQEFSEFSTG
ncbi:acylphosphatase [Endozoicomonas numazuensis]|uniref:acylphosphatase n=1 Tax=Endozoicomonas numazuensis TaxID=1137799 RepID=A0A081NE45_9GAMM|nr:acylphosphatase [Endozoicomonas numazuensis]KEQ16718.1 acylphosphatase [Endozoicomonas numazuensis]